MNTQKLKTLKKFKTARTIEYIEKIHFYDI